MNKIQVLIISSSIDFSSDLICYELEKRSIKYLRINRDNFLKYEISYMLESETMIVKIENEEYIVNNKSLNSIYFRAPVFLRETGTKKRGLDEQLYRSQWYSFIRNLIIFDEVIWLNNPVNTYKAENKLYQLKIAKKNGLSVPKTILTNDSNINIDTSEKIVVKSLDTALFNNGEKEMFTYANIIEPKELKEENLKSAPILIQQYIFPKIDIRATVIGRKIFAVKILKNDFGISEDWRREKKDTLQFEPIKLPEEIEDKIFELMKELDLSFGGIDLIYDNNKFYFIEVNPTGEWGWLVYTAKLPIYKYIVDFLCTNLITI